jgi:hypothetical protein
MFTLIKEWIRGLAKRNIKVVVLVFLFIFLAFTLPIVSAVLPFTYLAL